MQAISWNCKSFQDLSLEELYAILKLRSNVFVVEQDCAYLDPDGDDQVAWHLMGLVDNELSAYARLLPPGLKYEDSSIGRVVTEKNVRRGGFGKQLMQEAIEQSHKLWPGNSITISAQHYLEPFYQELLFETKSDPYMEDGIPHVRMQLK